jgi:alkylation response protein AidB-like acyl-CoA dehydrogenase
MDVMAMRGLVWQSARRRTPAQGVSSTAKAFCGDRAFAVATRAMGLMADHGYLRANRAEKAMRDARLNQIYEGTNQINRLALIEAIWASDLVRAPGSLNPNPGWIDGLRVSTGMNHP